MDACARGAEICHSHYTCAAASWTDSTPSQATVLEVNGQLMSPAQSERTTHGERDGEGRTAAPPRPSRGDLPGVDPDGPSEQRGDGAQPRAGQRERRGGAV